MIHANSHPADIVNCAEEMIIEYRPNRFGSDKSAMSALFNVLAPVQWLEDKEWEEKSVLILPRLAHLVGKNKKAACYFFLRDFHHFFKNTLRNLKREDTRLFCESLKASYYFHCPVGQNAVSR